MRKKGQTTTFIVVGLLLLITIGMVVFVRNMYFGATEIEVERIQDQPSTLPPLKTFVSNCIIDSSKGPIHKLGLYGGSFNSTVGLYPRTYVNFHGHQYASYCRYEDGEGCLNHVITRQVLEKELAKNITPKVERCINLSLFEKLGYRVEKGELKVGVTIAFDEVIVNLTYPITIEKVDDYQTESDYFAIIRSPLGKLYDLSVRILNDEQKQGYFDKDEWMVLNGEVDIHKKRPYLHPDNVPTIIYNLSTYDHEERSYSYLFSLIDRNTVLKIGDRIEYDEYGGIDCFDERDYNCFFNVPSDRACSEFGLVDHVPGVHNCTGLSSYDRFANNNYSFCNFGGYRLRNGQTVCASEGPSTYGNNYVGSRFYVVSCHHGDIFVEGCKDYREEICTYQKNYTLDVFEYNITSTTKANYTINGKAMCRPNRWYDCLGLGKADCLDDSLRDCIWDDPDEYLNVNTLDKKKLRPICVPKVPPGFMFWNYNGMDVCELGNDFRTCDGMDFSCPQVWTNQLDRRCSALGDCGNAYNFNRTLSERGFWSSDDRPYNSNAPFDDYSLRKLDVGMNLLINTLNLSIDDRNTNPSVELRHDPDHSYTATIEYVSDYIEEAMDWDICGDWFECRSIFGVEIPETYIGHVISAGVCMPWQAPADFDEMNCLSCSDNEEMFPCTEYKCKSLGEGCNFRWDDSLGAGICQKNLSADIPRFNMTFISYSNGLNHSAADNTDSEILAYTDYLGVEANESIAPNQVITIRFNTSVSTKCYPILYPNHLIDTVPGVPAMPFLSGTERNYTKNHKLDIAIPSFARLYNKSMDYLNLSNMLFLSNAIADVDDYLYNNQNMTNALNEMADEDDDYNISKMLSYIQSMRNNYTEVINVTESMIHENSMLYDEQVIYLFMMCQTPGGTRNKGPIRHWYPTITDTYDPVNNPYFDYLKIKVNNSYNISRPPKIIATDPPDNMTAGIGNYTLKVYTDIPAECRITTDASITDFYHEDIVGGISNNLDNMECTRSNVNVIDNNYCKSWIELPVSGDYRFYIKCRSNPRNVEEYSFKLRPTANDYPTLINSSNIFNTTTYTFINSTIPTNERIVHIRNYRKINHIKIGDINDTNIGLDPNTYLNLSIKRQGRSICYYNPFETEFWENMNPLNDDFTCSQGHCNTTAIRGVDGVATHDWFIKCIYDKNNKTGYVSTLYEFNITAI